jgi:hypothetical protein
MTYPTYHEQPEDDGRPCLLDTSTLADAVSGRVHAIRLECGCMTCRYFEAIKLSMATAARPVFRVVES